MEQTQTEKIIQFWQSERERLRAKVLKHEACNCCVCVGGNIIDLLVERSCIAHSRSFRVCKDDLNSSASGARFRADWVH
jgi:hypothetical protein